MRLELADILRQYGADFLSTHRLPARHRKVIGQITNCRTAVLGGHRQQCARCGFQRYRYHSCRNRHCPKCQTVASRAWREARQAELLPVPYFHNVFTLPHELNNLILRRESNQRAILKLLFDATAQTLLEFGRRHFGGQVGFTLVLHTWDQQLRPHFHLHCLIAAGAWVENDQRWIAGGRQFLFPVKALSRVFRGKFLAGLKELFQQQRLDVPDSLTVTTSRRQLISRLFKKPWVVYSKAPFAGPAKLLDYLSRYTHRVAITNSRLVACRDGQVTFTYRDRRDGDRCKRQTLPVDQFIRRFLCHILPSRFMRIRHYGFLANRYKQQRLAAIRGQLGFRTLAPRPATESANPWLIRVLSIDTSRCPCCGDPLHESKLPSPIARQSVTEVDVPPCLIRGPPT